MKSIIVLGLVGEIASGKSTVADFLITEFKAEAVSFSQPLRDILDILSLPQNRENMVWLGVDLRARFGQDILAKAVFRAAQNSSAPIICLPNIRLAEDITVFKAVPNFYLVKIEAHSEIRYQRLCHRRENPDDQNKTWAEFLSDSQLPTEISIREVAKSAQFALDNNTDKPCLFDQVKKLIQTIGENT